MLQGGIVMKFEKLNNDKIRIILDLQDLKDNDIDYQSLWQILQILNDFLWIC